MSSHQCVQNEYRIQTSRYSEQDVLMSILKYFLSYLSIGVMRYSNMGLSIAKTDERRSMGTQIIPAKNNSRQLAEASTSLFVSCVTRNVKTRTWWDLFFIFFLQLMWQNIAGYAMLFRLILVSVSVVHREDFYHLNIFVMKGSWSSLDNEWYGNELVKIIWNDFKHTGGRRNIFLWK